MKVSFIIIFLCINFLYANKADVLSAKVHCNSYRTCNFDVTVKHHDKGWKHFANAYEILSPTREILDIRVLAHPHVNEQPFTRSIFGVKIPKGINSIIIRARDSLHGYGGKEIILELFKQ